MSCRPSSSASTLATSVLPTPASPSSSNGLSRARHSQMAVARPRSARYAYSASAPWTSSGDDHVGTAVILRCSARSRLLDGAAGEDLRQMVTVLRARQRVVGRAGALQRLLGRGGRVGAGGQRLL